VRHDGLLRRSTPAAPGSGWFSKSTRGRGYRIHPTARGAHAKHRSSLSLGSHPTRRWSRLFVVLVAIVAAFGLLRLMLATGSEGPRTGPPTRYVVGDIAGLPISGTPYSVMKSVADGPLGAVDLEDQDSTTAAKTLAAALVYARTGDEAYRSRVVAALEALPEAPLSAARVLSVARQLAGFAMSADLVGYRDPGFVTWIGGMRTKYLGGHSRWTSVTQCSEDSPNNWGAWATASRAAISAYVGDNTDLARVAKVFRGFLGDRRAYAGFQHTDDYDPTWAADPSSWTPINPGTTGKGGAIVEDISRSAGSYPRADETGSTYSWETLGGAMLTARVLKDSGYVDVYAWADKALLRAALFLHRTSGYPPDFDANQYIPWQVNRAYGVRLGPVAGTAGYGRQFGYTDWLTG
jgi:hypothetical protein